MRACQGFTRIPPQAAEAGTLRFRLRDPGSVSGIDSCRASINFLNFYESLVPRWSIEGQEERNGAPKESVPPRIDHPPGLDYEGTCHEKGFDESLPFTRLFRAGR